MDQTDVMSTLADGTKTLTQERAKAGLDEDTAAEIMDNLREAITEVDGVSEALKAGNDLEDDDELLAEFDSLDATTVAPTGSSTSALDSEFAALGLNTNTTNVPVVSMPVAPIPNAHTAPIIVKIDEEDQDVEDEFAALSASMN
jgi:hypothetical protein